MSSRSLSRLCSGERSARRRPPARSPCSRRGRFWERKTALASSRQQLKAPCLERLFACQGASRSSLSLESFSRQKGAQAPFCRSPRRAWRALRSLSGLQERWCWLRALFSKPHQALARRPRRRQGSPWESDHTRREAAFGQERARRGRPPPQGARSGTRWRAAPQGFQDGTGPRLEHTAPQGPTERLRAGSPRAGRA